MPKVTYTNLGNPPQEPTVYPEWKQGLIRAVDQALCVAWNAVVINHHDAIRTKDEDIITDALVEELTHLRRRGDVGGFTAALFSVPSRDAKLPDCHGVSIDQMPDITVRLAMCRQGVVDDRHDALFFECKVLDGSRGLDHYRIDGIDRFVTGRYAWRMPHAGMLAYLFDRKANTPTRALTSYASRMNSGRPISDHMRLVGGPDEVRCGAPPHVSEVAMTLHDRTAPAVNGETSPVTLRHMWFKPA